MYFCECNVVIDVEVICLCILCEWLFVDWCFDFLLCLCMDGVFFEMVLV